mgnify:CR=1 FL=1
MQGVEGAKGFQVNTPNTETYLRDVENEDVLYIKSTDQSGMPLPLRVFDYTERSQTHTNAPQMLSEEKSDYISRDEFDAFRDEIRAELRQPKVSATTKTSKEK